MKNIVLIGMPATGKSTVGVILAKLLGYDYIDTDILIARGENRTLTQILEQDGYDRFIEIEGAVGEHLKCEKTVVATGGSMVLSEKAMKNLSENAAVVWLDTPVKALIKRLSGTLLDRGVATKGQMSFQEIFEMREPLYRKYADLRLAATGTTQDVVLRLKERLLRENLL